MDRAEELPRVAVVLKVAFRGLTLQETLEPTWTDSITHSCSKLPQAEGLMSKTATEPIMAKEDSAKIS